mgnify:CR=1 FL=1
MSDSAYAFTMLRPAVSRFKKNRKQIFLINYLLFSFFLLLQFFHCFENLLRQSYFLYFDKTHS